MAPRDVIDLLSKAVGISVRYQGRKNPYFIDVRGGGSLTYIIDGAILPSTINKILPKIPLNAIEEIQIVCGASSLTLGPSINIGSSNSDSGLNVGYVIIKTKQPKKELDLALQGSLEKSSGFPWAHKESVYAGARSGEEGDIYVGGLLSNFKRKSSDSWFDGQDATAGMANAGFTYDKFSLNLMAYKDKGSFDMQRGVQPSSAIHDAKWYLRGIKTQIFTTNANAKWGEHHTTIASIFTTKYEHEQFANEKFGRNIAPKPNGYWEKTNGFSLRHNMTYGGTTVMLDAQSTNNNAFGIDGGATARKFKVRVIGYSGSVEQRLFDDALVIDGGYRWDRKHIDYSSSNIANLAQNNANNDVDMAPSKIYAFGAKWNINQIYALSARYFNGDQGTTGDFDVRSKTGSLDPEKQRRMEASFEANLHDAFAPSLTYFDIKINDEKIATNQTYTQNGNLYYYYTQSDTKRNGLEFLIKGVVKTTGTSYKASYTRLLKYDSTSTSTTTSLIAKTKPRDLYTLQISQILGKYTANLSAQRQSGWSEGSVVLGDYTRVDANVIREFNLSGDMVASVMVYGRNLGNKHYSTIYRDGLGYFPDRGLVVGLEATLKY